MKKQNRKIEEHKQVSLEKKVESGLACFVKAVKNNLWSRIKKGNLAPATIRDAEVLEEKFNSWGSHQPCQQGSEDAGNRLYMDHLMHHRVSLATEIVKSMANGRGLSQKREKVLRSSIDYIEQQL